LREADDRYDIWGAGPLRIVAVKVAWLWIGPARSRRPLDLGASAALVVGGLLVLWSGGIHFHLWQSVGYKHLATIGPLFLLQSIGALVVGLLLLVMRRVWAALLGAGFALSTLAGFLISVTHGLFGFQDSWEAPFAKQAFAIEIAIVVILSIAGALCLAGAGSAPSTTTHASPVGTSS
jgi:hypothetical protein